MDWVPSTGGAGVKKIQSDMFAMGSADGMFASALSIYLYIPVCSRVLLPRQSPICYEDGACRQGFRGASGGSDRLAMELRWLRPSYRCDLLLMETWIRIYGIIGCGVGPLRAREKHASESRLQ
jgi:hypothetical protein